MYFHIKTVQDFVTHAFVKTSWTKGKYKYLFYVLSETWDEPGLGYSVVKYTQHTWYAFMFVSDNMWILHFTIPILTYTIH